MARICDLATHPFEDTVIFTAGKLDTYTVPSVGALHLLTGTRPDTWGHLPTVHW